MNEKFKRKILHLLFPTKCPVCGCFIGSMDRFCINCAENLHRYNGNFNIKGAESFTASFIYDDGIIPAVMLMKYGICGNAGYALGNELADRLADDGTVDKIDIIIAVPMYRRDKRARGYNQSDVIARVIGKRFGIPVADRAVVKIHRTKQQKMLDRKMRMFNLKGAYAVRSPEIIFGKRILLVDDVCTTGSTFTELTSLILENGALEVRCAACCHTPDIHEKSEQSG